MRISDWSSDVCSSDLAERTHPTFSSYFASRHEQVNGRVKISQINEDCLKRFGGAFHKRFNSLLTRVDRYYIKQKGFSIVSSYGSLITCRHEFRSEEHTSELQSLMRISYAVFCLKKKKD